MLFINEIPTINTVHETGFTISNIKNHGDMLNAVRNYKKTTFKLFPIEYLEKLSDVESGQFFGPNYRYLSTLSTHYFTTSKRNIFHIDLLLSSQLANPKKHLVHPIIDQLWFTLPATKQELKKLKLLVRERGYRRFCKLKSFSLSGKNETKEKYFDCWHFIFSAKPDHRIEVLHGLSDNNERQNAIKIAFNPARFTSKEIKSFFSWIRRNHVFCDYSNTMQKSNVTRLDIATDIIGLSTPMFLATNKASKYVDFFPVLSAGNKLVQTQVLGNPEFSHFDVYSRNHKLISKNISGMLLMNEVNSPIPITRVERCWRPQKSNTPISVSKLELSPNAWKQIDVYSPRLLCDLHRFADLQSIARTGFAYWYNLNKCKLIDNGLDRDRLYVNLNEFYSMQQRALRALKRLLIA